MSKSPMSGSLRFLVILSDSEESLLFVIDHFFNFIDSVPLKMF
jgi:hypothetical protein